MANPFSVASSVSKDSLSSPPLVQTSLICSRPKLFQTPQNQLRLFSSSRSPRLKMEASGTRSELSQLTRELKDEEEETRSETDVFSKMNERFLTFKKQKYLNNSDHFQSLAKAQSPKFMVIACADSRVCPSNILGFQPGEAFTIRNIANIVPPYESGPSETKAGLEFAVNSLKVENIFVIGHSCCGGIRALMSMEEEEEEEEEEEQKTDPSFIKSWVAIGKNARQITKKTASKLSFDHQCRHCEKESINASLLNLLTYPWIEEKVKEGSVSIHGGYYDFVECTFEKWTVCHEGSNLDAENREIVVKNRAFWC